MGLWLCCLLWRYLEAQVRKLHYSSFIYHGLPLVLTKNKIINLNKYLLHNGSCMRCFTLLHNGQRKLWIYPVYLGRVPLWLTRKMRRMRAARLKRSNIPKAQETPLKSMETGPQNDSRVSQTTWKTWPLGFAILAFELLLKFLYREHELCSHSFFYVVISYLQIRFYIVASLTLKLVFLFYLTDGGWLWNINANSNINNELNNESFGLKSLTPKWIQTLKRCTWWQKCIIISSKLSKELLVCKSDIILLVYVSTWGTNSNHSTRWTPCLVSPTICYSNLS